MDVGYRRTTNNKAKKYNVQLEHRNKNPKYENDDGEANCKHVKSKTVSSVSLVCVRSAMSLTGFKTECTFS